MNTAKQKAFNYYLKRCSEEGIEQDLFDFEAMVDSSLSYSEIIDYLEEEFFNKVPSVADATYNQIQQQKEKAKKQEQERENIKRKSYKQNWKVLSEARSIYILGSVRTGKSSLAFGLAKKLQEFKKVYYFNFPKKHLLKEQGFYHLENLNQISLITDAVIVMDEIALSIKKYEKKNNDELQKILTLAGQNNLTIIFISQISQMVNKTLESLIDCFVVMDFDYQNIKNGSRCKNMIKDYSTFAPEHFKLNKGEFLFYSRNFPVFESFAKFPLPENFTAEWSLAYKNQEKDYKEWVKEKINFINW